MFSPNDPAIRTDRAYGRRTPAAQQMLRRVENAGARLPYEAHPAWALRPAWCGRRSPETGQAFPFGRRGLHGLVFLAVRPNSRTMHFASVHRFRSIPTLPSPSTRSGAFSTPGRSARGIFFFGPQINQQRFVCRNSVFNGLADFFREW